jgi:hypothetical protein
MTDDLALVAEWRTKFADERDQAIAKGMLEDAAAWHRRLQGFLKSVSDATGDRKFLGEARRTLSYFLADRYRSVPRPPVVELPPECKQLIERLKANREPATGPRFINLEDLSEAEKEKRRNPGPNQYTSERMAMRRHGPSPDWSEP